MNIKEEIEKLERERTYLQRQITIQGKLLDKTGLAVCCNRLVELKRFDGKLDELKNRVEYDTSPSDFIEELNKLFYVGSGLDGK